MILLTLLNTANVLESSGPRVMPTWQRSVNRQVDARGCSSILMPTGNIHVLQGSCVAHVMLLNDVTSVQT